MRKNIFIVTIYALLIIGCSNSKDEPTSIFAQISSFESPCDPQAKDFCAKGLACIKFSTISTDPTSNMNSIFHKCLKPKLNGNKLCSSNSDCQNDSKCVKALIGENKSGDHATQSFVYLCSNGQPGQVCLPTTENPQFKCQVEGSVCRSSLCSIPTQYSCNACKKGEKCIFATTLITKNIMPQAYKSFDHVLNTPVYKCSSGQNGNPCDPKGSQCEQGTTCVLGKTTNYISKKSLYSIIEYTVQVSSNLYYCSATKNGNYCDMNTKKCSDGSKCNKYSNYKCLFYQGPTHVDCYCCGDQCIIPHYVTK